MFGKLIKAEWRSSRRVIGALCAVVLISGLVLGLLGLAMTQAVWNDSHMPDVVGVICVLLIMAAVIAVALSGVASLFYALWRFYKSRFTEEGYLTYTLPVNGHQLMLSSILASCLEILAVAVATMAAVLLAGSIFLMALPWGEIGGSGVQRIADGFRELFDSFNTVSGDMMKVMLSGALAALSQLMVLMLSVTIGAIVAKKRPILMAIVTYYCIQFLQMIVGITAVLNFDGPLTSMHTLGTADGMSAVIIVVCYGVMYFLTTKKLNLN